MPPEVFVFLSLMALALAVAIALTISRGRSLEALRESLAIDHAASLPAAVRAVQDDLEASRFRERRLGEDIEQVIDQLEAGVVRLDDDLTVVRTNRAARWLLGQRTPAVGRSAMEAFVDHRIEQVARAAMEAGSATGELVVRGTDERTVLVRGRRAATGGVWLVLEDVTELRRLQRIRTEFIDNLAHELRTPLTTVRLLTETVARDLDGADVPPRIRDRILKIDVETGHLVQMVNELLDLSRIEGGASRLLLDEVEMGGVIRSALERLRPFADRKGVGLVAELSDDGELPRVWGDEERLGQLLVNLLHNAVKFSPGGSRVIVRARRDDGQLVLTVRDEGVGIPTAELDRVFERFYKVDKARVRGQGGTGLGLAIARHIAEGHGGRIWVESEEGVGSTFSVAIPIATEAQR